MRLTKEVLHGDRARNQPKERAQDTRNTSPWLKESVSGGS